MIYHIVQQELEPLSLELIVIFIWKMWNNEGISMNNFSNTSLNSPFLNSSSNSPASGRTLRNQGFNVENEEKSRVWNCLQAKPTG